VCQTYSNQEINLLPSIEQLVFRPILHFYYISSTFFSGSFSKFCPYVTICSYICYPLGSAYYIHVRLIHVVIILGHENVEILILCNAIILYVMPLLLLCTIGVSKLSNLLLE